MRPGVDTEFSIDVAGVSLDRVQGEIETGCDLWVRQALGDELKDLPWMDGLQEPCRAPSQQAPGT